MVLITFLWFTHKQTQYGGFIPENKFTDLLRHEIA